MLPRSTILIQLALGIFLPRPSLYPSPESRGFALSVGQNLIRRLDRDSIRILPQDRFKPFRDRLLNLLFLNLDEGLGRMEKLRPNGLLFRP